MVIILHSMFNQRKSVILFLEEELNRGEVDFERKRLYKIDVVCNNFIVIFFKIVGKKMIDEVVRENVIESGGRS